VTTIREIIDALERFAPLPLQDDYDNSGLQVGLTETEASGALLCLDVTEAVIEEARSLGYNLIVSHHPLIFHPLKQVTDATYQERCVMLAVKYGITLYACHTNLDNAEGGVSFMMAQKLGLENVRFLSSADGKSGAGVIGNMHRPYCEREFCDFVKRVFAVDTIRCNEHYDRQINTVALCGGAGAFLIPDAVKAGADAFLTGEVGYHRFFGYGGQILLMESGHFESERYTVQLLGQIISNDFPELPIRVTELNTNPIRNI